MTSDAITIVRQRHFLLRRLHSLSGVIPVGAFLVEHLWTNTRALYGRTAFNHAVGEIQNLPLLLYIEVFLIGLPLLFHAGYGMLISTYSKGNVHRYGWTANWLYALQRVSGVITLGFIVVHLWQYRIAKALGKINWPDFYHQLTVDLNRPMYFALYVLGVTASVFHFANGLRQFAMTWGITVSTKSMRKASWVAGFVGIALWVLAMNTLLHFSFRCGGVIPLPEQQIDPLCGR